MHECTSIIINSFHLFQQTLFNKGIRVSLVGGVWGGASPIQQFFRAPPIKINVIPWDTPPSEKQPPPIET